MLRTEPLSQSLTGAITVPGDKSISHRALILASLAEGRSVLHGLLHSEDTAATMSACQQLGAEIYPQAEAWIVNGCGQAGLAATDDVLDMGNSGTAMRLLAGVLAAQPFVSTLVGDHSLNRRPMRRIIRPLQQMGANVAAAEGGTPPLTVGPADRLQAIRYVSPVASAQVKSCVLLAGLYAQGITQVIEPAVSRDHTERMLPIFGAAVQQTSVEGPVKLQGASIEIPGDLSSAAFHLVAASIVAGSDILLKGVGVNPTRSGVLAILSRMGADIKILGQRIESGEPVADLRVRAASLSGVEIGAEDVALAIDELPVIMVAAVLANGITRIRGAAELRVKESDRIAVMAAGLSHLGVELTEYPDGIEIHGAARIHGGQVDAAGDHRCAMSFAVLGQLAEAEVEISGAQMVATSYPDFVLQFNELGGIVQNG